MHQWRNWQTRTLQARMGDRVGSSPTWCTSLNTETAQMSCFLLYVFELWRLIVIEGYIILFAQLIRFLEKRMEHIHKLPR